jgi:PAS domain-containing protein
MATKMFSVLSTSKIATLWERLTEPHALIRDPEQRHRARLLSSLLMVAILLLLLDLAKVLLQTSPIYPLLAGFVVIAIAYGLSRTQHYPLAVALTAGIVLIATSVPAMLSPQDPLHFAYLIFGGLLCSLFLSLGATTLVFGITVAEILLLAILVPGFPSSDILNALMLVIAAGVLILTTIRIRQRYLEQIEERSRELADELTECKRTEAALAAERNLLSMLTDSLPDGIYFKDDESRFIRINRAQARGFGLDDPAQAIGKTDFEIGRAHV